MVKTKKEPKVVKVIGLHTGRQQKDGTWILALECGHLLSATGKDGAFAVCKKCK
jgi:hypothetical protein